MSKQIHIHLHRATAKDATTAELREKGRTLRSAGKFAEAARAYREAIASYPESQKTGALGKADIASLEKFASQCETSAKTGDSVASVEKEIAQQQRLIDAAKAAGKDVPGTVTQRMKFLKEELDKEKNKTADADPQELPYQALARARKRAQELVDKLSAAMDKAKAGRGVMREEDARAVEDLIRPALYKVV